jgi:hypothetical protein
VVWTIIEVVRSVASSKTSTALTVTMWEKGAIAPAFIAVVSFYVVAWAWGTLQVRNARARSWRQGNENDRSRLNWRRIM